MDYTPNLNLKKPAKTDPVLIDDLNENADIIDQLVGTLQHQAAILKPEGGKLWHFDTSLESTDGIKPLEGAVATLRPNEGRFGGAVAVEEGTTNLYSNPFFRDGMTGWSQYDWGGGGTAYVEAMKTPVGDYALVMDNAVGTGTLAVYKTMALPDATSDYTLSLLVKNLSDRPCTLSTYMGVEYYTLGTVNPGDGWVRLTRTFVAGEYTQSSEARNVRIAIGRKVAIAAIQLEQKPFATSFVDGTRAAGRLEYPGVFQQGTISAWVYLDKEFLQSLPTTDARCLLWGNATSGNTEGTASLYYVLSRQNLRYRVVQAGGTRSDIDAPVPETGWHHFVTIMHGDKMALYVDGEKVDERQINVPMPSNNTLQVGSASTGGHGNFLFDELLILPYATTEEEIKGWYEAKKPFIDQDEINTIDQKLKELAIGTHTPDQTQVPTSPGSGTLSQILSWFANRIKAITGKTNWWEAPPTTLQAAKTHMDAAAPHSGHETPSGAQTKVDTHAAVQASLSQLGHVNHAVLTTTLNTTWQGSQAPYTKTQTVNGLLATDTPIVDVVMSGTFATDEARLEAWGYVYRITTANNAITLYATEKPTVSLPIQLKVVR